MARELVLEVAGIQIPLAQVADCDPERVEFDVTLDETDLDAEPGKAESGPETTS